MSKILIVEDDMFLSNAYRVKLQEKYTIEILTNGEKILETIETFKPDLILLDLMMPTVDGFEVLKKLKKAKSSIPVIVLTNLSQVEDKDKALGLGAVDFLIKSNTSLKEIEERSSDLINNNK